MAIKKTKAKKGIEKKTSSVKKTNLTKSKSTLTLTKLKKDKSPKTKKSVKKSLKKPIQPQKKLVLKPKQPVTAKKKSSKVTAKTTCQVDIEALSSHKQTTNPPSNLEAPNFTPYKALDNEQYMNEKQLLHFKSILKIWQDELMQEVDHTLTELKEAGAPLPDLNDRATQEENLNFELRARDRERKLLKKISEALQQIDEQTYGYCESCGVEIGIRRLEARPTATLCIDCKTISEIKEKRN